MADPGGQSVENPADILNELRGDPLSDGEVEAAREFERLTAAPARPGQETERAAAIVTVFDDFFGHWTRSARLYSLTRGLSIL